MDTFLPAVAVAAWCHIVINIIIIMALLTFSVFLMACSHCGPGQCDDKRAMTFLFLVVLAVLSMMIFITIFAGD